MMVPAGAASGSRPIVPRSDNVMEDVGFGFDCADQSAAVAVTGTLLVRGSVVLSITGVPCPAGRVYIVVDNDGTDPILGTFDGVPEGGLIAVGTQLFQISYVGGTGNDLTATALDAVPAMDHLGLVILTLALATIAAVILR